MGGVRVLGVEVRGSGFPARQNANSAMINKNFNQRKLTVRKLKEDGYLILRDFFDGERLRYLNTLGRMFQRQYKQKEY